VSRPRFSRDFFAAGGMKGMSAVIVHPYTFNPEPETRTRAELRNQRDYTQADSGQDLEYYVTEYGWPSVPPKHQHKVSLSVSEERQAQRTVRQSVMLYSEDMKTLIPHMMGDREQKPDDWDDHFGFFRLNGQPRPVVIAHSVSARLIDRGRYVGEFRLGHKIGGGISDPQQFMDR
jgi:hypothetical protein